MSAKCDVELKLLEICRLCLTEEGNKISIFDEMDCGIPLTLKISFCVSVEVAAGDGLPELICQKCTSHVNSWYIFKKECQKSDAYLRDFISKKLSALANKNNETHTVSTESAFEGKLPARRNGCGNVPKCTNSKPKRRNTSGAKQRRSADGKEKLRTHHERGLPGLLPDVVLEEGLKEEDSSLKREGCDVNTKCFQTALEEDTKTKEVDTKNGLNLAAAAPCRVYTCSVCQKTFASKSNLQEHEVTHSGDKKFACKDCDKAFFSKRKLKLHSKTHSVERPCLCSVCGKSFREKSDLKRHFRLHSEESPFLCNVCGKTFKTKFYLNRHLVTHSGERKFICSECGKAFRWRDALLVHVKVHALERPLPCSVCGKGFKRKEDLIRHTRIHTGEKPFVCGYCGRCFSDKWNLTQHVRLHTGQKPYVCSICSQAFTHNVTLRKHAKLKHCNSN